MKKISRSSINEINENPEMLYILQESCGADKNNGFICPYCGSGSGSHGTGVSFFGKGKVYKCFACGTAGPAINWYMKAAKKNFFKSVTELSERLGIILQYDDNYLRKTYADDNEVEAEKDFSALYAEAASNLEDTDYWKKRGLSLETCKNYGLGFAYHNIKDRNYPYLLLPSSKSFFIKRYIDDYPDGKKTHIEKGTHVIPFNSEAFREAYETKRPVFIVEGVIDALSVIEAGGLAVGMNGAVMRKALLQSFLDYHFDSVDFPIYISLDNDEPGLNAAKQVGLDFALEGISTMICNISGACKDPNELLCIDRQQLADNISSLVFSADDYSALALKNKRYSILNQLKSLDIYPSNPVSTGFPQLDDCLEGGFFEELYVCNTSSIFEKNYFLMQICDYIARNEKKDVLYFPLNMTREEFALCSISRNTFFISKEKTESAEYAKSVRDIAVRKNYAEYSRQELDIISAAIKRYNSYADRIFIFECESSISVKEIHNIIESHISDTGKNPIVIIECIPCISPSDSDSSEINRNLLELKYIAHNFKIPVICATSLDNCISDTAFAVNYLYSNSSRGTEYPLKTELRMLKNYTDFSAEKVYFDYRSIFHVFTATEVSVK